MSLRRNIAKSIQAALVLLALVCPVSCFNRLQEPEIDSGTTPPEPEEPRTDVPVATKGGSYDIVMSISAAHTEDGNFECGDENEMGPVGSNYAILFDKDENIYGIVNMTHFSDGDKAGHGDVAHFERAFFARFIVGETEEFPKYCLAVLNGSQFRDKIETIYTNKGSMSAVLNVFQAGDPDIIGRDGAKYFTMTNAVYDGDVAAEILPEHIHETAAGTAIDWDALFKEGKVVDIHVERMVAKFTLNLEGNGADDGIYTPKVARPSDPDYLSQNHQIDLCVGWNHEYTYTDENGVEKTIATEDWEPVTEKRNWKAKIVGWGMNAQETESYVFKQYGGEDAKTQYRSYWAIDPHYYTTNGNYPWQYLPAVDCELNWYGNTPDKDYAAPADWKYSKGTDVQNGKSWTNLLRNYSWKDDHLDNAPGTSVYTPENTYNYNNRDNEGRVDDFQSGFEDRVRMNLHAGTHLIVRAELLVQEGNSYELLETLYRDRDGVYYRTARECLWSLIRSFNHALASQTKMAYRYYDWTSSTDTSKCATYYAVPTTSYQEYVDEYLDKDGNVKFDAEDETKFKLYYNGGELKFKYENGQPYLYYVDKNGNNPIPEDKCKKLLAKACIKNGDGKRLLNTTAGFSIKRIVGDNEFDLPIYTKFEVGNEVEVIRDEDGNITALEFEKKKSEKRKKNEQDWPIDENDVQSLIFEWVGAVDYFVKGMMYYPHPVYDSYNANGSTGNSNAHPGVVRNAWYKFTLTGIDNIGIPVYDADQPIVPNWDRLYDRTGVNIEIIPPHIIDMDAKVLPNNPWNGYEK